MARPFPDHPMCGVFAPLFVGGESGELPVLAEVPPALRGDALPRETHHQVGHLRQALLLHPVSSVR